MAVVAEQELALVVAAPEAVRLTDAGQRCAGQPWPPPVRDQAVPIQDGVDGTDCRTRDVGPSLAQSLANLRRAPRRVVFLEADDECVDGARQLIRVPIRPAAPIAQTPHANLQEPLRTEECYTLGPVRSPEPPRAGLTRAEMCVAVFLRCTSPRSLAISSD